MDLCSWGMKIYHLHMEMNCRLCCVVQYLLQGPTEPGTHMHGAIRCAKCIHNTRVTYTNCSLSPANPRYHATNFESASMQIEVRDRVWATFAAAYPMRYSTRPFPMPFFTSTNCVRPAFFPSSADYLVRCLLRMFGHLVKICELAIS